MRKITFIIALIAIVSNITFAQYKEIPYETKTKLKSSSGLILGFINPKNFSLTHSFNMSFVSSGNANLSLASYTATLSYNVLKNLKINADVTMQYSPFASIGGTSAVNKDFQNSFNGINLSRVSLDWRPAKNMYFSFNYINNKNGYWYNDLNYMNRWNDFNP
jgi:hypothetical protein